MWTVTVSKFEFGVLTKIQLTFAQNYLTTGSIKYYRYYSLQTRHQVPAVRWYRAAADGGDTAALHQIGLCYGKGSPGMPRNDKEANAWFLKVGWCKLSARE